MVWLYTKERIVKERQHHGRIKIYYEEVCCIGVKFMEIKMILETERLYLREMDQADFNSLCNILQDKDTMYAYEGAFSDNEVQEWLDRQISHYQKWNFGLWAVI